MLALPPVAAMGIIGVRIVGVRIIIRIGIIIGIRIGVIIGRGLPAAYRAGHSILRKSDMANRICV